MTNSALVFIKPHAVRRRTVEFIEDFLKERGIILEDSGELSSDKLKQERIVDRHYFAIAKTAVELPARELNLSEEAKNRFQKAFGEEWDSVISGKRVLNAAEVMDRFKEINAGRLNEIWTEGTQTKLGPGLYAGKSAALDIYIINGFYPSMRERFTAPGLTIRWYDVTFDPQILSWSDFRQKVIGATDPQGAAEGSLRNILRLQYSELGLDAEPTVTNNGVHASAGPIEGMRERMVWLGIDPYRTELALALQEKGFSRNIIDSWLENGPAELENGDRGPVFDITEDMDADKAVQQLSG